MNKTPLIIPIFIPHSGCLHKCIFCNQNLIANKKTKETINKKHIDKTIKQYLKYKNKRLEVELAFFGGNFLGLSSKNIIEMLDFAETYIHEKQINKIRFSTRPDTITKKNLELIEPYNISTIEIGVQSMNNKVLKASKRGHTKADTICAINLLKKYPFKTGVQVMIGLPEDNEKRLIKGIKQLALLKGIDFARIYPLIVFENTVLAKWYKQKKYHPLSLKKSIDLTKKVYLIFKKARIKVIRMGLQTSDIIEDKSNAIAGPWHPAFGHLVFSSLFYDNICDKINSSLDLLIAKNLVLIVHPNSESRLRGNKNSNLKNLNIKYPDLKFSITCDKKISKNKVLITKATLLA